MQVNIQQMTQAILKVSKLAANDSNAPGVLLKIRDGEMEVCYSNGRQAITERIDTVHEDNDLVGEIVVPYQRLVAIIDIIQPSGRISTSDITMRSQTPDKMEGVMDIDATKYLIMYREDGSDEGADKFESQQAAGEFAGEETGEQEADGGASTESQPADQEDSGDTPPDGLVAIGPDGQPMSAEDGPAEDFDNPEYMQESAEQFALGGFNQLNGQVPGQGKPAAKGSSGGGNGAKKPQKQQKQAASDDGYVEETCTVAQFHQKVSYADPSTSTLKYGLLTRMNYDNIFVGDDGETNQDFDVWKLEELRDMLTKMALEKNRTIYASHAQGAVFVVNIAYASWVATESVVNNGFTITTNLAKSVTDILASMAKAGVEEVLVKTKEHRYVNITDTNHRVGLWFEMVAPSRTDAATLQHYRNKQYGAFRVLFSREALENVLASAMATDKVERTTISFIYKDSHVAMRIESTNSGASVSNVFDVISYGDELGLDNLLKEKLVVSLKTLSDMVRNCTQDFVELAVDIPADGGSDRFVRVGDVLLGDSGYNPENAEFAGAHYTVAGKG